MSGEKRPITERIASFVSKVGKGTHPEADTSLPSGVTPLSDGDREKFNAQSNADVRRMFSVLPTELSFGSEIPDDKNE